MLRGPVSRRYFVSLLASGAVAWPFAVRAQQGAMPAIGLIRANTPEASVAVLAAFRQGLSETGYVEKRNITIEYRWAAQGHYDQLPALAADLVRRKVSGHLEKFLSPSRCESDSLTARGNGRMEEASHGAEGLFRC
jgi:putative ABC transport system substrate-binding protein